MFMNKINFYKTIPWDIESCVFFFLVASYMLSGQMFQQKK